jgi:hypothetical protein
MLTEHGYEPIRGLPERLPEGEVLLWQGAPDWRAFARHALHLRWIAAYFVLLAVWRGVALLAEGASGPEAAVGALWLLLIGCAPIGLLALYALLVGRTTVYTLTSRRLVLRVGVALPFTINLPFALVQSAGLRLHADGTGDIVLTIAPPHRIAWLMLWPHTRPGRLRQPEPMLRCIPDAAAAAQTLARALAGTAGQAVPAVAVAEDTARNGLRPAAA